MVPISPLRLDHSEDPDSLVPKISSNGYGENPNALDTIRGLQEALRLHR